MKLEFSEQELLKGFLSNNQRYTSIIYKQHFGLIQNLVLKNNGTADDAKDIFQEAMVILYENAQKPEFELTSQISTYLYAISRRLWLKKLQTSNNSAKLSLTPIESIEESVAADDEIDFKEKQDNDFSLMEVAMKKLGEPCKSLLEAYYIHKKQMHDIADQFGYTNSDNAKNQKYKCLMRLKKLFFAQYKY